MNKIIPFKKNIIFKTNLAEVTSISLENTLKIEDNIVSGNFIVSGEYKVTNESLDALSFLYELPFKIAFDSKYNLDNATLDIEDFYYEIINDSVLSVNIEVLVDKIEQIEIKEELEEQRCIEPEDEVVENTDIDLSIFDGINIEDTYNTYKVYIVRENDTIESIIEKYNITKEQLEIYNDLKELKLGDKLIIPVLYEGN